MVSSDRRIPSNIPRKVPSDDSVTYKDFVKGQRIDQGSYADVYRATIRNDDTVLALKELRPRSADNRTVGNSLTEQFEAEAEIWAALDDHAHIVEVAAWDTDPQPWIAMEYMDGSLKDQIEAHGVEAAEALWIGVCIARAVRYAHDRGVSHQDLKPQNVLLKRTEEGRWNFPKVGDWGLAKRLLNESPSRKSFTPEYAAPEILPPPDDSTTFGEPDWRVDIFQLGAIVYELIASEAPFSGPQAILSEDPGPITQYNSELPAFADTVFQKALAKHVDERYYSILDFERDLERLLSEISAYEPQSIDATHQPTAGDNALPTRESRLHSDLRNQGFQLIDDLYLLRRTPKSFEDALQTGLRPVEAKSDVGYVLDRTRRDQESGERVNVTEELLTALDSGASRIVVGPGGSGKSAICLGVVRDWLETDRGPVMYRASGHPTFTNTAQLSDWIRAADGHALVVVEDAMRAEAAHVYTVLDEFKNDDSVSFLLDARENEYESGDPARRETSVTNSLRDVHYRGIDPVYVPPLDEYECERFIEHVEEHLAVSADISPETLYERVAASKTSNQLLILAYHLLGTADDLHPLQQDVIDKYETLDTPRPDGHHAELATFDDTLRRHAGLLIAMLAAVDGLSLRQEYFYALRETLPTSPSFLEINGLLTDGFDTWLIDIESDEWGAIQSPHEVWAVRYLRYALSEQRQPGGQQRKPPLGKQMQMHRHFVNCLEAVLTVHRDESFRRELGEYWGRQNTLDGPAADVTLDAILKNVFRLGKRYQGLTPLFEPVSGGKSRSVLEPTEIDGISTGTAARLLSSLGWMHSQRGDTEQARTRFSEAKEIWYKEGIPVGYADTIRRIGRTYRLEGEYDKALDMVERSLELYRRYDIDDGRAYAKEDIGTVARLQANHAEALDNFKEALEISQTEWRQKSLAVVRGIVYHDQGQYERAREEYEMALELARELGFRIGEGYQLNNIGRVARHSDLDEAERRSKQALTIFNETGHRVGAAQALNNLAKVELRRGRTDRAGEYARRALAQSEGVDRRQMARSRHALGRVHLQTDRLSDAHTAFRNAVSTFVQIDDSWSEARSRLYLGRVYNQQDKPDHAIECFETAARTFEQCNAVVKCLECYRRLVTVSLDQNNVALAREWCQAAQELIEQSEQSPVNESDDSFNSDAEQSPLIEEYEKLRNKCHDL